MIALLIIILLVVFVTTEVNRARYASHLKRVRSRRSPEAQLAALWRAEDRLMALVFITTAIAVAIAMAAALARVAQFWAGGGNP